MKQHPLIYITTILILISSLTNCGQKDNKDNDWVSFADTLKDEYGYLNQNGDTIIPSGKYSICFTDSFKTYAIVLKDTLGFVAIDKQENVLYKIFPFDNGPDYTSDGVFRIVENNKIGFADSATGKIIIVPKFDCAFPFKNGVAKVSTNCSTQSDGEHSTWLSEEWYYIDKTGKKVNEP